jgi:hypothetical protein
MRKDELHRLFLGFMEFPGKKQPIATVKILGEKRPIKHTNIE